MFTNSNCASVPLVANIDGNGNNNNGWGDSAWWIIILLIFGWGGFGGNGWGGNGMNGGVGAEVQRGFDTQSIISKLDGLSNGLCDGFYSQNTTMLQGFNGLQGTISEGFHGVDSAICNLGYQTQNGFNTTNVALMQAQNALQTQLANCCCENREGQAQIRYDMATQSCQTRQAIADSTKSILDFLTQDKIASLTAENQSLKFQASQTAQNAYIAANQEAQTAELIRRINPMPVPAYTVPAPYAYTGCGCNSGCC